jgi:septum formation protein
MGAAGGRPLLLASRSPRRAALLEAAGIPFERAAPLAVSEALPTAEDGAALDPGETVRRLAARKVRAATAAAPGRLVLAADTLVFLDGRPLGKPDDAEAAVRMLRALSGREHLVATGVALAGPGREPAVGHAATRVRFRALEEAEIRRYVATGEPLDKAGAYGIQGGAGAFVASLEGDEDTVVGLPVALVRRFMALWEGSDEGSSRD